MENIITIIVILIIGIPMFYIGYVQMIWLFNKDKVYENQIRHIKNKLVNKNIKLIQLYVPTERKLKEAPFKQGLNTFTGASDLMALKNDYYFVIKYKQGEVEKEGWVKIIESVFFKSKYMFYDI